MYHPTPTPALLDLLQRQPEARLQQIARTWGCPHVTAKGLYRFFTQNHLRFREHYNRFSEAFSGRELLLDLVQDFNLPVPVYPSDRVHRQELVRWGLIFPYPSDWPGTIPEGTQQWHWVMPLEIAVLCASDTMVERPSLPLLLGMLPEEKLNAIHARLELPPIPNYLERVLRICDRLLSPNFFQALFNDPDWYEHSYTLQVVLEWHGFCYQNELFSFAWGDETLRPLTARGQESTERQVASDLEACGLLFDFTPPPDPDPNAPPPPSTSPLMVLPEELRPAVWGMTRNNLEQSIQELLQELGGWAARRRALPRALPIEPVDQLKALSCLLESSDIPLKLGEDKNLTPSSQRHLQSLSSPDLHAGLPWAPLIRQGLLCQIFTEHEGVLGTSTQAPHLLDQDAAAWSRAVLKRWIEGESTRALDDALNLAMGLSHNWLKEIRATLPKSRAFSESVEAWWRFTDPHHLGPPPQALQRHLQRPMARPVPSWLFAQGLQSSHDVWCGFPRLTAQRQELEQELLLVESIMLTFRLLWLDMVSGLNPRRPYTRHELTLLTRETACLAVHLNLAAMLFDMSGNLFVPVRPPSFLMEGDCEALFQTLSNAILDEVLIPAGLANVQEDQRVLLYSSKIAVSTPSWYPHEARQNMLSRLTGLHEDELFNQAPLHTLRPVMMAAPPTPTSEKLWLGQSLSELKNALQGHQITALHTDHLDIRPKP